MRDARKRETRLNYVVAQAVKPSAIAAEIVRNHTGHRELCKSIQSLKVREKQ